MANIIEPILYMQTDKRWSGIRYAANSSDRVGSQIATIGNSGCGPSCMAMVISTLTGKTVTPEDTCAWALQNGYKALNQGTYYSYFEPQGKIYGISVKQMSWTNNYKNPNQYDLRTRVLTELHDGNWVIAVMGPSMWTVSGHFVLAWYCDDEDIVYIKDPYNTGASCSKTHKSTFLNAAKYFWLVDVRGYMAEHDGTQEHGDNNQEEEMVEEKTISIFGSDYTAATIVKDERNYMSPRVLEYAGLEVTNEGAKPIVKMPGVKVNGKVYPGFYNNGRAFIALEDYEKDLGSDVGWDGSSVIVKR